MWGRNKKEDKGYQKIPGSKVVENTPDENFEEVPVVASKPVRRQEVEEYEEPIQTREPIRKVQPQAQELKKQVLEQEEELGIMEVEEYLDSIGGHLNRAFALLTELSARVHKR